MRPVRAIGFYLLAVFLGGAVLAPWLYDSAQIAAQHFPELQSLAAKPFPRYVSRSLLLLALIWLPSLLQDTGLKSWRAIGINRRRDWASQFGSGFILGLTSLAVVALVTLAAGIRVPGQALPPAVLLSKFVGAALTAMVVACLEELLFRGVLFGALRRELAWPTALVLSSALYAFVHFLEQPGPVPHVIWSSGLTVLGNMIAGSMDWQKLVPGFFNLSLAGLILGLAYQRSGSLYLCIGLHAGWILWLKSYGFLTDPGAASQAPCFFGTARLIDGWLAFIVLAAVLSGVSMMSASNFSDAKEDAAEPPTALPEPPKVPPMAVPPPVQGSPS